MAIVAGVILLANSIYIKKLDEVKAAEHESRFDAAAYAHNLWEQKLIPGLGRAIEINRLIGLFQTDPGLAFEEHSNALGIGAIRYFLVRGEGRVNSVNENEVALLLETDSTRRAINIATELIFGNAIRDASGLVDINEFTSTVNFNSISEELNKIVRDEVLPPFKNEVEPGDGVIFTGAVEMNMERLDLDNIEVIPVDLKIRRRKYEAGEGPVQEDFEL